MDLFVDSLCSEYILWFVTRQFEKMKKLFLVNTWKSSRCHVQDAMFKMPWFCLNHNRRRQSVSVIFGHWLCGKFELELAFLRDIRNFSFLKDKDEITMSR